MCRNAAGSASARSSRVSYAPNTVGGIDEEDSGFLEDEAESKSKAKVGADGKVAMTDYYAAKEQEEARKKQKEKEAAEAAAAAIKERSKSLNSSAAQPAAGAPKRKYKLLSVYPLLSPNMRREEWSLKDFKIDKKLHAGYASEVYRVSMWQNCAVCHRKQCGNTASFIWSSLCAGTQTMKALLVAQCRPKMLCPMRSWRSKCTTSTPLGSLTRFS